MTQPQAGRIHLDHAATSPLRPAARDAWLEYAALVGNPRSSHTSGRQARALLEDAREQIAACLAADPAEVVLTSGGSEANTIAVLGGWRARRAERPAVVTSTVEHPAVAQVVDHVPDVRLVGVDGAGALDRDALGAALDASVGVVSVQAVNSETGVSQDLAAVVEAGHAVGAWVHSDLVQGLRVSGWSFVDSGLDLASVSAHKLGGPLGVGVLLARREVPVAATGLGAGQEREVRSGTQTVALAASLAAALQQFVDGRDDEIARLGGFRRRIEDAAAAVDGVRVNRGAVTACGIVSLTVDGARADDLVVLFDQAGVDLSVGTACRAGVHQPSQVLLAMGRIQDEALSSIRVSMGWTTSDRDIEGFVGLLPEVVARARGARSAG